jgi:2'-5' RNA ligase
MRLFTAIDFNTHHDYLAELQGLFQPTVKASFPRSFHLTLKFLGEVPETKLDSIKSALRMAEFPPFTLSLASLGAFPGPKSPRVIWIGVKPAEQVISLQKKIEGKLADFFPVDSRFHPHITLARVKFIKDRDALKTVLAQVVEPKGIDVQDFELIKSVLTPRGPLYETIDRIPAKGL